MGRRVKSKNLIGATGREWVYVGIRDTRWRRGYQSGKQNNQSQSKNKVPECVQTGTSNSIWLHAAKGAKQTGLPNTGAVAAVTAFSYICCLHGNYNKHLVFENLKKGKGHLHIYDLWTCPIKTRSNLNNSFSDGLSIKTHSGFPGHHIHLPGLQNELIWP